MKLRVYPHPDMSGYDIIELAWTDKDGNKRAIASTITLNWSLDAIGFFLRDFANAIHERSQQVDK